MKQTRTIEFDHTRAEGDSVPCVLSSDTPVERGDYLEVLEHSDAAVNLERAPLPLIEGHDSSRVNIGIVENLRVAGGKLRGQVKFGASTRARELLADVVAGIVRGLSIGYSIDQTRREGRKLIATRWTPFELSAVAVPADPRAGFYRGKIPMTTEVDDDVSTETGRERFRVREILAMGEYYKLGERTQKAIAEGMSADAFRRLVLEELKVRSPTRATEGNLGAGELALTRREIQRYSISRAIRAQLEPARYASEAGFEREVSVAMQRELGRAARGFMIPWNLLTKRDLTVGTPSAGGYTVATNLLADEFIDVLRNASVVASAGARFLPDLKGNVAIPRRTAGATVQWVAENAAAAEGSNTFDQVTLSPKTVTGYVDASRRLLLQSTPGIDQLIQDDLTAAIMGAVDAAALAGTGTSNQPTGVLNTSGIGDVAGGTNGLAPTWAHIVELMSDVAVANAAIGGRVGYITNEKVRGKLAVTPRQGAGVEGNFIISDPNVLFGSKFLTTNSVPSNLTKGSSSGICSAILFGNWADLIVGMWSGLDLLVDQFTFSSSGGLRISAFQDVDVAVRHPESFSAMKDALTT